MISGVNKGISKSITFLLYCDAFALDSAPEFGEFPSLVEGCQGRLYEMQTEHNKISPRGQDLWVIHDDLINRKDEYNALKVHACRVLKDKEPFNMLITKFEVQSDNIYIERSLDAFLSCLVVDPLLFNSETIYAWVDKANVSLSEVLKNQYSFKKSKVKLHDSKGNKIKCPKKTVQLKVKAKNLKVGKNIWLENVFKGANK
jgi:hypothetical protein